MGIFDFFSKKKSDVPPRASEREVSRLERMVSNKLSQNYDRQEAIEELGRMGTAASAAALFKRFDWTLDPSITDHEEKEAAVRGIVAAAEDALEPLRAYSRRAESLTWPLKALRLIVGEDKVAEELLGILDQFDTEYVRNSEPKVQLIQALEVFPTEEVRVSVEPFLADASEPVRFIAATTIFALDNPASVPAIIAALEVEESLRTKNRIAQGLAERDWTIPAELSSVCATALPSGFRLIDGHVRRAG
jgi:HEAT repeat protein